MLGNALSGDKHGDYINKGKCNEIFHNYPSIFLPPDAGYSDKIDSLRAQIAENQEKTQRLLEDLKRKLSIPRLTLTSHKSFVRVIEVSKSQTSKVEKCSEMLRYVIP